jgi:arylsulfatase A-like enzyme
MSFIFLLRDKNELSISIMNFDQVIISIMDRKFRVAMILVVLIVCGGFESDKKDRNTKSAAPNIIVMYSDDHTAQAIGAYRDALNYGLRLDHTPTPHIDRLAEGGMRFDNAFVTNSICTPSRAVMMSGLHSHMTGVLTNAESMPDDIETFPMILQMHGYQTAMIGKWHLKSDPLGFDYYEVLIGEQGQGTYYNPTFSTPEGDVEYHGHTTGIISNIALRWLRLDRDRDKPFMMIYNHKAPHREWLPGPALDDYRDRDLPEPKTLFYDYSGLTTAAHEQDMEIGTTMRWGWDLKVPVDPETGEDIDGWGSWQQLIDVNRLTDEQLERIVNAYSEENEYLLENYHQMSEKERLQWRYHRYVKDYMRVVR